MGLDVKVAAAGMIALCLILAAVLFMASSGTPDLQTTGNQFFDLAIVLIVIVVALAIAGIKVKFP
jgi:uncharacterized membrane protein YphA (DoxX/SURF4 family)